jgi:hypothetical protein
MSRPRSENEVVSVRVSLDMRAPGVTVGMGTAARGEPPPHTRCPTCARLDAWPPPHSVGETSLGRAAHPHPSRALVGIRVRHGRDLAVRQSASKGEFVSVSEAVGAELVWAATTRRPSSRRSPPCGRRREDTRDSRPRSGTWTSRSRTGPTRWPRSRPSTRSPPPGVEPGERLAACCTRRGRSSREHAAWALGSRSPVAAALRAWSTWSSTVASPAPWPRPRWSRSPRRSQVWCAMRWSPRAVRHARGCARSAGRDARAGSRGGHHAHTPRARRDDRELPAPRARPWPPSATTRTRLDAQVHAVLDAVAGSDGPLAGSPPRSLRPGPAPVRRRSRPYDGADRGPALPARGHRRRPATRRSGRHRRHRHPLVHLGDALLAIPVPCGVCHHLARPGGDDPGLESVDRLVTTTCRFPSGGRPCPLRRRGRSGRHPARGARILDRAQVDVLHLRMADVGSWAAAEAAHDLGVPWC